MFRGLENTSSFNTSVDELDVDYLSLLKDHNTLAIVEELIRAAQRDLIKQNLRKIEEWSSLLPTTVVGAYLAVSMEAAYGENFNIEQFLTATEKIEENLVTELDGLFSQEEWQLFAGGLAEVLQLRLTEAQKLSEHVDLENQDVVMLAWLHTHDIQEWSQLAFSDFVQDFLRKISVLTNESSHNLKFLQPILLRLIEFILTKFFDNQYQLTPLVAIHELPENSHISDDGEIEIEIPHAWYELQKSFVSEGNLKKQALSEAVGELEHMRVNLTRLNPKEKGLAKIQLELEPVQIYLEIVKLKNDLESWFNRHIHEIVTWTGQSPMLNVPSDIPEFIGQTLEHKSSFYYLMNGHSVEEKNNSSQKFFFKAHSELVLFVNLVEFFNADSGLESMYYKCLDILGNLITMFETVVPDQEATQQDWNEFYPEMKVKLIALQERIEQTLETQGKKKKTSNKLTDDPEAGPEADNGNDLTIKQSQQ